MLRQRIWNLILGLSALVNLNQAGESIRQALLSALKAASAAAALTPGILDNLLVSAAIALVQSPAWDTLLEWIRSAMSTDADLPAVPIGLASLMLEHGVATEEQVA